MEPTKVEAVGRHYFKQEEPTEQPKGDPDYPRYETHENGHRVLIHDAAEHEAFEKGTADGASVASHPVPDVPPAAAVPEVATLTMVDDRNPSGATTFDQGEKQVEMLTAFNKINTEGGAA